MKYIKLYTSYRDLFRKLNAFALKNVILLLLDYVETGNVPEIRSKKRAAAFNALKQIHDGEIIKERSRRAAAGREGARRRWRNRNNGNAINNYGGAIKGDGRAIKNNSSAIFKDSTAEE